MEVASIAVTKRGKLLWLRRRWSQKLTLPAGKTEPGEEPLLGAIRELKEESGLSVDVRDLEYLGDGNSSRGVHVFAFTTEAPDDFTPSAGGDPDHEALEFLWLDELPSDEESHVPTADNITLRLLGLVDGSPLEKAEDRKAPKTPQKEWRSKDGLKIPHRTSPSRREWDKAFHSKLAEVFTGGDPERLRPFKLPVTDLLGSNTAVNKPRLALYTRMLKSKDRLPPVVVRQSGQGFHLVDGNHRLEAARAVGARFVDAVEALPEGQSYKPQRFVEPPLVEPQHDDSNYSDEDGWTEAKYRRGGHKEFEGFLKEVESGLHKAEEFASLNQAIGPALLYRAYKNSPHHPVSLLLKYIVHRLENQHFYQTTPEAEVNKHDQEWLAHHQQGGAAEKNAHITVGDLRGALVANPNLAQGVLKHQKDLHAYLKRHNPSAIQTINGEPSVALARGYKIPNPMADHDIASYTDHPPTARAFGSQVKSWHVPLKNLWYSFNLGPKTSAGNMGPEDEFLASNHPRVDAPIESVKRIVPLEHYGYKEPADSWALGHTSDPNALRAAVDRIDTLDSETAKALAKNPHLPADAITAMLNKPDKPYGSGGPGIELAVKEALLTHQPNTNEAHLRIAIAQGGQLENWAYMAINATPEMLAEGFKSADPNIRRTVISNSRTSPSTVLEAMDDTNKNVRAQAVWHPHATSEVLDKGVADPHPLVQGAVVESPHLQPHHISALLHSKTIAPNNIITAMSHPNASSANLHEGLSHHDPMVKLAALKHASAQPEHLKRGLEGLDFFEDPDIGDAILGHPNATPEILETGLAYAQSHADPAIRNALFRRIASHPNLSSKQLHRLIVDPDNRTRRTATVNPSLAPEHIVAGLEYARKNPASISPIPGEHPPLGLINHPNANADVLDHVLNTFDPSTNYTLFRVLARHPKATPAQLGSLLDKSKAAFDDLASRSDPALEVNAESFRSLAQEVFKNPNASADNITQGLNHPSVYVQDSAIRHPNHTAEHVTQAMKSDSPEIRKLALKSPHVTQAHIAQGVADSDSIVRDAADVAATRPQQAPSDAYGKHLKEKLGWRETEKGLHKSEEALEKMALVHDDFANPKTVYRVQNKKGEGPYTSGSSATYAQIRPILNRPVSATPEPDVDFDETLTGNMKFGFLAPEHAKEWFGPHGLKLLANNGYTLQPVAAKKVWVSKSGKQVTFEPHDSELQKMSLADIHAGAKTRNKPVWDYSHLLSPEHRAAGYGLKVLQHSPTSTFAALTHPTGDEAALGGLLGRKHPVVGLVTGHTEDWRNPKELIIGAASVEPTHRGDKGVPMYEALMAHAKNHRGLTSVRGDEHSTMAHKVHAKLAAKHGMQYSAPERAGTKEVGPYDEKFGPYSYVLKNERDLADETTEALSKGLATAAALVGALAMGGGGGTHIKQSQPDIQAVKWSPAGLHPHLIPIAHLESSFGQNVKHLPSPKGEYDTAHGPLGLKPNTAHEEYLKSPILQKQFGDLKDPADFMARFKADPKLYNLVATSHFLRLLKKHGSAAKAAYAWRLGTNAAAAATDEQVQSLPYVQRYKDLSLTAGLKK
jgi:8-oxo-dGTP pyrophosphatase MutT (NUDIX family)